MACIIAFLIGMVFGAYNAIAILRKITNLAEQTKAKIKEAEEADNVHNEQFNNNSANNQPGNKIPIRDVQVKVY